MSRINIQRLRHRTDRQLPPIAVQNRPARRLDRKIMPDLTLHAFGQRTALHQLQPAIAQHNNAQHSQHHRSQNSNIMLCLSSSAPHSRTSLLPTPASHRPSVPAVFLSYHKTHTQKSLPAGPYKECLLRGGRVRPAIHGNSKDYRVSKPAIPRKSHPEETTCPSSFRKTAYKNPGA